MASAILPNLLRLPPQQRAEIALALWESLMDAERQAELTLSSEQAAELDRRWNEHLANPTSAAQWQDVRRKLLRSE